MALNNVQHPGIYTNTLARFDTLTLGAIIALLFFYSNSFKRYSQILLNVPLQLMFLVSFLIFLYKFYFFDPHQVLNVSLGFLIIGLGMANYLYLALQPNTLLTNILSTKFFVWLGKISYGLYIWHILALEIAHLLTPLTR